MDTFLDPQFLISPADLAARMGRAEAPLLLDVRPEEKFSTSSRKSAQNEPHRWKPDTMIAPT